MENIKN